MAPGKLHGQGRPREAPRRVTFRWDHSARLALCTCIVHYPRTPHALSADTKSVLMHKDFELPQPTIEAVFRRSKQIDG
jgi:hypothetical protein